MSAFKSIEPAFGRTIDGLTPCMPCAEAIEKSLGGRLRAVDDLIPLAADGAAGDARIVHRLRVSTRRAAAAIKAFSNELPKKRRRRVQDVLRDIRRSASVARSSDVDLAALRDRYAGAAVDQRPALALIAGMISHERMVAAATLIDVCNSGVGKELRKSAIDLLDGVRKKASSDCSLLSVAENAVSRQRDRAVKAAQGNLRDIDQLHQLRIECKRLRYTIESIGPCADELNLRAFYDVLVESQDHFGEVNDAHEFADRVESVRTRLQQPPFEFPESLHASLGAFSDQLGAMSRDAHMAFLRWWSDATLRQSLGAAEKQPSPPQERANAVKSTGDAPGAKGQTP